VVHLSVLKNSATKLFTLEQNKLRPRSPQQHEPTDIHGPYQVPNISLFWAPYENFKFVR
jgi:hypothetical protein